MKKVYVVFVDLKKAYDSVPHEVMWKALAKYGYPSNMIKLIRSFHDGMSAKLKINGELLEGEINVTTGLWQGCTIAPTLQHLFQTCGNVEEFVLRRYGVSILYNVDDI